MGSTIINAIIRIGICKINAIDIKSPFGLSFKDSTIFMSYKHKTLLLIPHAGQGNPVSLSNRQKCGKKFIRLSLMNNRENKIKIELIKIFQFI